MNLRFAALFVSAVAAVTSGCFVGPSDEPSPRSRPASSPPPEDTLSIFMSQSYGGPEPHVGDPVHVGVQLLVQSTAGCHDADELFSGDQTCTDGSTTPRDFSIDSAACDDGGCIVEDIGAYIHYGRELTLRAKTASPILRVRIEGLEGTLTLRVAAGARFGTREPG